MSKFKTLTKRTFVELIQDKIVNVLSSKYIHFLLAHPRGTKESRKEIFTNDLFPVSALYFKKKITLETFDAV